MDTRKQAEENLLFKCRTGSHAYGMATPTSDLDIRGVFAADRLNVITPFFPVEQVNGPPGTDEVYFELSKYVKLVCDQNPSILELLWVDERDVLLETPTWRLLKELRGELLCTKLRNTYGGYAMQQLHQIKSHNKWLNNPQPEEAPRPMDFVGMVHNLELPKAFNHKVPRDGEWTAVGCGKDLYLLLPGGAGSWFDGAGALRTFTREEALEALSTVRPAAIIKFARDEYEARKRDHENYWTWRKNRNKARGAVEEKIGFDGKNAAHLIRLMRTGCEALTEGLIRVRRPDAEELLAIRRGEWSYEQVLAEAEAIDARMAEAEKASPLPKRVNQARVGELIMRMYESAWGATAGRRQVAAPPRVFDGGLAPDLRGRVIMLDVEGTGYSSASKPQIVEVAAVEVMGGVRTGRVFHTYVDPQGPVSDYATRIHGLTEEFLRGKPTFGEVAPGLLEFLGDSPIVAHNASSDVRFLNQDLTLVGQAPLDGQRFTCSQRAARRLFPGTEFSLDSLCDVFGVDRTARARGHSALVDASLLAECMLKMAELPGYASLKAVGLRTKAARLAEKQAAAEAERVVVNLSEDGRTARFTLADGRVLEAAVPDFPVDTHWVAPHAKSGALIVRRRPPGAGPRMLPGYKQPDNPCGPAALVVSQGAVKPLWFADGKPVPAPEPETAPGPRR